MDRRQLLASGVATALVATTTAIDAGSEVIDKHRDAAEKRMKAMEERFDKLEHHHKNLIRMGGLAFAMSTGIDLVTFL